MRKYRRPLALLLAVFLLLGALSPAAYASQALDSPAPQAEPEEVTPPAPEPEPEQPEEEAPPAPDPEPAQPEEKAPPAPDPEPAQPAEAEPPVSEPEPAQPEEEAPPTPEPEPAQPAETEPPTPEPEPAQPEEEAPPTSDPEPEQPEQSAWDADILEWLKELGADEGMELVGVAEDTRSDVPNAISVYAAEDSAQQVWAFYLVKELSNDPANPVNYIQFGNMQANGNRKYGVNIHKAYNSAENTTYWAYCLNVLLSGPSTSHDYSYTITDLPSAEDYQIARYVLGMGYGTQSLDELKQLFGYTLTNGEAYQGTQAAIWAAQKVKRDNITLDAAFSNYSVHPQKPNSQALLFAKALAQAAYSHMDSGWDLSVGAAVQKQQTNAAITFALPITAKNLYGGYTVTFSGLPAGSTISGGSRVEGLTVTSETVTGTDTLLITVPRTAENQAVTVAYRAKSYLGTYSQNSSVLFGKPDNPNKQNLAVANPATRTQKMTNGTFRATIPHLTNGQITITKRDAVTNEVVPNVTFALYEYNENDEYVDTGRRAATNSNGVAKFDVTYSDRNQGKYQVFEVASATHQVYNTRYVAFISLATGRWAGFPSATAAQLTGTATRNTSGSYDFTFSFAANNLPKVSSLAVIKRDADTGAPLAGCTFQLYEWKANALWDVGSGTYVATDRTAVTDATGQAVFDALTTTSSNCGKFIVKEVSAPPGYELDTAFFAGGCLYDGWWRYVSSMTALQSGTLPDGGTVTGIVHDTERELITVTPGKTGFEFTVYMYDRKSQLPPHTNLYVTKTARTLDGTQINLSGAEFGLCQLGDDGQWIRLTSLEETDKRKGIYGIPKDNNGNLLVTLTPNTRYKVVEESAPAGVINTGWEQEFQIDPDNPNLSLSFVCEDRIPTGSLQLHKEDAQTGLPLAGVTFAVTAKEDITYTLGDTTYTVYRAGDEVAVLTTQADGKATLDGLYYGTYEVTETAGLENYAALDGPITAVVGAPEGYQSTTVYPDAGIAQVTYPGTATFVDYEVYDAGHYSRYTKDEQGNVLRFAQEADGSYSPAEGGQYAQCLMASIANQPIHPDMAVAKLADRTTNPDGKAVRFDRDTGRYTETKMPGTYYNHQQVTFTLTSTNTGDVDLYHPYLVDVMSAQLWTVVANRDPGNLDSSVRTTDVCFRDVLGNVLTPGSTVKTVEGDTVTVEAVSYNDVSHTYRLDWNHLRVGDAVTVLLTFEVYNHDDLNKLALPNDVYLYAQYHIHGDSGALTDVPGGGVDDCHDDDAINVVSTSCISLDKRDGAGKAVKGAVFQLLDEDGKPVTWARLSDGSYGATVVSPDGDWIFAADDPLYQTTNRITTDAAGHAELVDIPAGEYRLVEVQTTQGNTLLKEPVQITLPYVVQGPEDTKTPDCIYIVDSNGVGRNYYYHLNYEITNTSVFHLPTTGGHAPWLLAAGSCILGLTLTAAAVLLRRRQGWAG